MQIVAVTRTLNEADIVEACLRHAAALADHHIVLDNGSTDGTIGIVEALIAEGLRIELLRHPGLAFEEAALLTALSRRAVEVFGADWVLPLDCDEFPQFPGPDFALRMMLAGTRAECVGVSVREYVATQGDDAAELLVPRRIVHMRGASDNLKVLVRASLLQRGGMLAAGAHGAVTPAGEAGLETGMFGPLTLAHFASRSPWQWLAKAVIGWSKVLAAGPEAVRAGHSDHYREPFYALRDAAAGLLGDPAQMALPAPDEGLERAPMTYRGGALRHTSPVDHRWHAVSAVMHQIEAMAIGLAGEARQE